MAEQFVSFYQICKEIAEEEGRDFIINGEITNPIAFNNYRTTRRRTLIELLKKINMLEKFQAKKGDDFQIPLRDKEIIKFFVRYHAEPLNKKVRQDKVENITGEDAKNIMEKFESTVMKNLPEQEGRKKEAILVALTQAQSRYAVDVTMVGLKDMWVKDIGNLTWQREKAGGEDGDESEEAAEKELRIANDGDAAFLIYYYHHLMLEQSRHWNKMVDIIDDLRTAEMMEMIDNEYDDDVDIQNSAIDFDDHYRDIRAVLMEAHHILFERHVESLLAEKDNKIQRVPAKS